MKYFTVFITIFAFFIVFASGHDQPDIDLLPACIREIKVINNVVNACKASLSDSNDNSQSNKEVPAYPDFDTCMEAKNKLSMEYVECMNRLNAKND